MISHWYLDMCQSVHCFPRNALFSFSWNESWSEVGSTCDWRTHQAPVPTKWFPAEPFFNSTWSLQQRAQNGSYPGISHVTAKKPRDCQITSISRPSRFKARNIRHLFCSEWCRKWAVSTHVHKLRTPKHQLCWVHLRKTYMFADRSVIVHHWSSLMIHHGLWWLIINYTRECWWLMI